MRRVRLFAFVLALAALVMALAASQPLAVSPNIVVSQVYGGGGNTGATYTHDFIELFNRGSSSTSVAGWSLQYTSATGTGSFGSSATLLTELPNVTLAPGQYLLVQEAQGAGGTTPLPSPDVSDPTPINMSGTGGKVALVNTTTPLGCNGSSTPCSPAALATVVDLVGWDGANFFEGAAPAPATTNTTAVLRNGAGCTDTDANGADFTAAAPTPRNTASPLNACVSGDSAPTVSSTTPANAAVEVAVASNVTVGFSEPVDVSGTWFTIVCTSSGAHEAAASGGPSTFTLDPSVDFASGESCTVTVLASQVSDQDTSDPPDTMAADYVFGFTTTLPFTPIHDIQGAAHQSSLTGSTVKTQGVVTARAANGYYVQDASPDAEPATSEGIFVFTSSSPSVAVGDAIQVVGRVAEFRPGGSASANLTTTELTSPTTTVVSSGNPLPAATVVGSGGRVPPSQVIDDDATGSVESSGAFEPATDGIDFYESLEGMRVQVNDAVAVGPTNDFGEIAVLGDGGANASLRTSRGGIMVRATDFNPERIVLDDVLISTGAMPLVDTGDTFAAPLEGVLDYSFGNFKLLVTVPPVRVSGGLARETAPVAPVGELTIATFNVENLHPGSPPAKFAELAGLIVNNLGAPDLLSLEEVQDSNGPTNDAVVDATATFNQLIAAIQAVGGPAYQFRQIDPVDDADGGQPGGNIRVGLLFRTDRGLSFVDRPGGDAITATTIVNNAGAPQLSISPGRIDPTNPAWAVPEGVRKPLVGEFRYDGRPLFVIANHWKSKSGDDPLFGHRQPPTLVTEAQRDAEAQVVNDFVDAILAVDPDAAVVVLGDLNDFDFSTPLATLKGAVLTNLYDRLPPAERYSYVFDGNSQALDHILVSDGLLPDVTSFDAVHVNAEFATRASDHDPLVAQVCADARPPSLTVSVSPSMLWPPNHAYATVTADVTVSDTVDPSPSFDLVSVTSNEPDNAPGGADGNTANDVVIDTDTRFRLRAERSESGTGRIYTITYRAEDSCENSTTRSATVTVPVRS